MSHNLFISYARDDDEPFAQRLYEDLVKAGFEVWWDRQSIRSRQITFHQEIADAIRSCDRLILVVGPKAAVSDYVRQEWRWALELDKPVVPVLRKGDYTHIPGELSLLHCPDFRDDAQYPAQLSRLIESLRLPEPPLGALFGVPSLPPHFLGRPDLLRRVKDALLVDLQKPVVITGSVARVGVQGMGGIGKSVLAAALARDREVRRAYPDGIIWVAVGQQPNLVRLQHDVAGHLGSREHFDTEVQGRGVLRQLLAQKAVLLVLDDVWQARDVEAFDVLGPRCRALVTTRDAGILHTLGGQSVPVSLFTEPEALQLLADATGVEPSALPPEAHEIVKECGCLPLAVALCGGMARKNAGQWSPILERLHRADLEKIADRQAINEQHQSIWRAMQTSVEVLSPEEQRRFAELSAFVTDRPVPEAAIATLWSHTGNLTDLGTTDLLISLSERSLIRLDQTPANPGAQIDRRISLHDLLYDFARGLAGNRKPLHKTLLAAYRKKCPNGWPTGPNDGYFYQRLAHHLHEAGKREDLKKLLFDYGWLHKKLEVTDANGLMADYDYAADDPQARLVQGAVRLSSHALALDRSHLPSQLTGRLLSCKGAEIAALLNDVARSERSAWLRPLAGTLTPPGGPLLRTLRGHEGCVTAVAVTDDGRHAVSGSLDNTLKVWDLASWQTVATLVGHEGGVLAVAVTPDGRHVVSGSRDKMLRVWDLASGQTAATLAGHEGGVNAVAVTPDGRYALSGSSDKTLRVWDLASGQTAATLAGHEWFVNAVAVTPDGRHVVSGSWDNTLKVWELASGRLVHTLAGHEGYVTAVAVMLDGRYVVSGSEDKTLRVWDLASGQRVHTLAGHEGYVNAAAVTPDGRYVVSGSDDYTVRVWGLASGRRVRTLAGHEGYVNAVAVMLDGRYVVSGSSEPTLRVWDLSSGEAVANLSGDSDILCCAVAPDGRTVVAGEQSGRVHFLRLENVP